MNANKRNLFLRLCVKTINHIFLFASIRVHLRKMYLLFFNHDVIMKYVY